MTLRDVLLRHKGRVVDGLGARWTLTEVHEDFIHLTTAKGQEWYVAIRAIEVVIPGPTSIELRTSSAMVR